MMTEPTWSAKFSENLLIKAAMSASYLNSQGYAIEEISLIRSMFVNGEAHKVPWLKNKPKKTDWWKDIKKNPEGIDRFGDSVCLKTEFGLFMQFIGEAYKFTADHYEGSNMHFGLLQTIDAAFHKSISIYLDSEHEPPASKHWAFSSFSTDCECHVCHSNKTVKFYVFENGTTITRKRNFEVVPFDANESASNQMMKRFDASKIM